MASIRIVCVAPYNHSATKDFRTPPLNKDDIARFDVVGKLPHCVCRVFLRGFITTYLLKSEPHVFFGRILAQVAEFVPTEAHDATGVEVLPHACAFAGCIEPIMDDFHPRVAKCVLLCFLFSGLGCCLSLSIDSFRFDKCRIRE